MIEKSELKEWESICSECYGHGYQVINDTTEMQYAMNSIGTLYRTITYSSLPCSKCKGNGKLDWMEVIKGVKHE